MRRKSTFIFILSLWFLSACGGLPEPAARQAEPALEMANPASEHCVQQGGELEIRDEEGGQVGYCRFPDGTQCEEWAFFNGECAPGGAYEPLDPEACIDLVVVVQETFTLDAELERAPFDDYISHISGAGCQATAVGSGYDFGSLEEASAILGVLLEGRGWQEDARYKAGGPAAAATAYRRENALCLSVISWEPAEGVGCPDDQPLAACELTPDQQVYTAALNCAQRAAE